MAFKHWQKSRNFKYRGFYLSFKNKNFFVNDLKGHIDENQIPSYLITGNTKKYDRKLTSAVNGIPACNKLQSASIEMFLTIFTAAIFFSDGDFFLRKKIELNACEKAKRKKQPPLRPERFCISIEQPDILWVFKRF